MLRDGRSIMERQFQNPARYFEPASVSVVVGFKKEMIMETFPDVSFIYNQNFGDTNTSKSLLKALRQTGADPVLWLNGDVVFDEVLLSILLAEIAAERSFVSVNTEQVAEEEVKHLGPDGQISELSKSVEDALVKQSESTSSLPPTSHSSSRGSPIAMIRTTSREGSNWQSPRTVADSERSMCPNRCASRSTSKTINRGEPSHRLQYQFGRRGESIECAFGLLVASCRGNAE